MNLSTVLVIAGKDLRQRLRDRSAFVLGFLAPVLIAMLMSFAFKGSTSFHADIAVVDQDRGPIAVAFTQLLDSRDLAGFITPSHAVDVAAADKAIRDGKVQAAVVIPAGFSASAVAGRATSIAVHGSVDHAIAQQVAASLADGFVAQINADHLAVSTAMASGANPSQLEALIRASTQLRLPEQVSTAAASGTRTISAISYYGPSMGIFFMFFGIGFAARSYVEEKRDGTLDRIAVAPVRPWVVIAGKSLSVFVYGIASLTTMAVVTSAIFGAYWGPPLAAAALIIAVVLATAALAALVMVIARTDRQAEGVSSAITFALVLAGGNFVFVSAAPDALRTLALGTPNGWAMRGFVDLTSGAGAGAAVIPVLAILAFAAVIGAVAAGLSRRAVTS